MRTAGVRVYTYMMWEIVSSKGLSHGWPTTIIVGTKAIERRRRHRHYYIILYLRTYILPIYILWFNSWRE